MSWFRQVKVLFTVGALIFMYIIWSILASFLFSISIDYKIYLASLISVFLMQFLRHKVKNKFVMNALPMLGAAFICFIFYPMLTAAFNSVYLAAMVLLFFRLDEEDVQYELYRDRAKSTIIALVFLGIVMPLINKDIMLGIFRFYILYLVVIVLTLREARRFANKLQNKNTMMTNIMIVVFIMLCTTDTVYKLIVMIFSWVWKGFNFVLDKMVDVTMFVLVKPLSFLGGILKKYLEEKGVELDLEGIVKHKKISGEELPEPEKFSPVTVIIFKVLLVLLVLYIIYKVITSIHIRKYTGDDSIVEKEKILKERVKKKNKGIFSRFLDRIFKGSGYGREHILNLYRKFEKRMDDREIYREHMTATQLCNVAKTQIEEREALEKITAIYNEAKFSKHEISDKNVEEMKDGYDKLKKY